MTADVIPMEMGTFKLSNINFYCAPGQTNGLIIHLGAIAELLVPDFWVLGMIGRTGLNDFEEEIIGELGRRILLNPYDYLVSEFDDAWENASLGNALEYLSGEHPHSLRFEGAKLQDVPRHVFVEGKPSRTMLALHVMQELEDRASALVTLTRDDLEQHVPSTDLITEVKRAA